MSKKKKKERTTASHYCRFHASPLNSTKTNEAETITRDRGFRAIIVAQPPLTSRIRTLQHDLRWNAFIREGCGNKTRFYVLVRFRGEHRVTRVSRLSSIMKMLGNMLCLVYSVMQHTTMPYLFTYIVVRLLSSGVLCTVRNHMELKRAICATLRPTV